MSLSQKPAETEITPSDFFEGVAEMRAHLDRNSSQSGREALTRMAFELTKPRTFDALSQWFCSAMARALAAHGAALLLEAPAGYVMHVTCGVLRDVPSAPGVAASGGTLMPLTGTQATFGALWVEHERPIDTSLGALLTAVTDAVAMSLESLRQRTAAP